MVVSYSKMKIQWNNEKVIQFIEDYRNEEVLWNIILREYKGDKEKREACLKLADQYECPEEMVKKKIKNIRTVFHKEHQQITKKRIGSAIDSFKKWLTIYNYRMYICKMKVLSLLLQQNLEQF